MAAPPVVKTSVTILLGGDACPLALNLQFVAAKEPAVIGALPEMMQNHGLTETGLPFPKALPAILPFQAPWTRILIASVGDWTVLVNNSINGGDGTAPGPAIMDRLGVRGVVATHAPRHGPGHAQTQLEVFGPDGEEPLMYRRTISASATDGRWEWHQSGTPFPFEETDRYLARVKRERFDRPMLLRYLRALGIPTDDNAYGKATLLQMRTTWSSREVTLEETRALFTMGGPR